MALRGWPSGPPSVAAPATCDARLLLRARATATALHRVSAEANQRPDYIWKGLRQSRAAERWSHLPSQLGGPAFGARVPPRWLRGTERRQLLSPAPTSPLQTQLTEGDRNSRKVENSSENVKYPACSQLHTAQPRRAPRA